MDLNNKELFTNTRTSIYDWISASNMGVIIFPFIQYVITMDPMYLAIIAGMLGTHFVHVGLKVLSFKYWAERFDFVKRPRGALNCDMLCRGGDASGRPGFPSGHMSTAAFFCVFIGLLVWNRALPQKYLVVACGCLYIVATGIARYKKRCHNIVQIIAGTLLGGLMAVITFQLARSFLGEK